jgi:hypothetical protein
MRTLASFGNDGQRALVEALANSEWRTIEQALASLTVFVSPRTVEEMNNQPVFRMARGRFEQRGKIDYERRVMFDDNRGPIMAFRWATGFSGKTAHLQFNHVHAQSDNMDFYTALSNICVTPTFLAKVTDGHGALLLRFRAWELFGLLPPSGAAPKMPEGYDRLEWAAPLDPLADVEGMMRKTMSTKPKDRVTQSVRELGWVYSSFQPDPAIGIKGNGRHPVNPMRPISPLPTRPLTASPGAAPVPSYYQLLWPTLRALKAMKGSGTIEEILTKVIELEAIPADVQAVQHDVYQTALSYNLAWARTYLKKAEAIQNPSRGLWKITQEGEKLGVDDFPLRQPRVRGRSSEGYSAGELVDQPEILADIEAVAPSWTDNVRSFLRGLTARRSKV